MFAYFFMSAAFFFILFTIFLYIKSKLKLKKYCRQGIHDLMLNNILDQALCREFGPVSMEQRQANKVFLYMEFPRTSPKITYVFDPELPIYIGRGRKENSVCIKDEQVSRKHCMIYSAEGWVCIQDFGTPNHTVVKRKRKKYNLSASQAMILQSKDKIILGKTVLKILLIRGDYQVIG